jgi:VanZ family protein
MSGSCNTSIPPVLRVSALRHAFSVSEMLQVTGWAYAALGWVGVIFFSSTSVALHWCEEAFRWLSELLLGNDVAQQPSFGVFHLLADKGFHVTLFLVFAVLLWKALPPSGSKGWKILLLGFLVGSCSEFLQRFFPDRDPALRDVLINVAGTALGLACSVIAAKRWGPGAARTA